MALVASQTSTLPSSTPSLLLDDGFGAGGQPRVWIASTTNLSSAVSTTGFWAGCGEGGHTGIAMRVSDVLIHISSINSATPGAVALKSVIASSANVLSTSASSGYGASYDVTVSQ